MRSPARIHGLSSGSTGGFGRCWQGALGCSSGLISRYRWWRVTGRTVRRWIGNEELWNGNREPGLIHALTCREGIIRWAWDTRHKTAELVRELATMQPHLQVVRLSSPAQTREWVASLTQPVTGSVP